jgi:TonB family protein
MILAKEMRLAILIATLSLLLVGCASLLAGDPVRVGRPETDAGQDIDQEPVPDTLRPPVYPEFARDANIQGTVVLHAEVGEDGHLRRVQAIRSVTGLVPAAVDAAYKSVFRPALKNGRPVAAWVTIPYEFRLGGGAPPPQTSY